MFEINNVSKKYNTEYVVRDLNLEIGNGLNFIIGSSGSGKTTLLKILSGLDNDYEGEVLYCGQSIKNLTQDQIAYYYNNKFGFVYQDFNLIEDITVEENILLSLHLKNINAKNEVDKILKKLKITSLRDKKVRLLSGGQKQRVAIARELVKNPEVIIADEPTSALDPNTAIEVIQMLREISKERTVIIVTHDTSLIDDKSKVYELDKGELISKPQSIDKKTETKKNTTKSKFDLPKAIKVGKTNIKSRLSKSIVSCISIMVSTVLLIISMGGSISNSGSQTFEELYKTYGNRVLDLNIVGNFSSADSGVDENDTPLKSANQDIGGLYQKYEKDDRVEMIYFEKGFDNIQVKVNGKDYYIEGTGNVPILQEILVGTLAKNKGEVLVPESFVEQMGISNEDAIGKEIEFYGTVYNHDSGEPIEKEVEVKAKICGVINSKMVFDMGAMGEQPGVEVEDEMLEIDIADSFFFDKYTLDEINKQADIKINNHNFSMRAKDAKSLIELKNELNAIGIVPIGSFELLGDIVNLENQTDSVSKASTIIISALAVAILVAISLVTSIMRKKEYAIYKVCGYSNSQLSLVILGESLIIGVLSAILIIVLSPVISILTKTAFGTTITSITYLGLGVAISLVLSMLLYVVSSIVAKKANPLLVLKSGER